MFEWHFIGADMKKRLGRSLLLAAGVVLLFFFEEWLLKTKMSWEHAELLQVFTVILGIFMLFFYLVGGIFLALWGTGAFGMVFVLMMLPSPWNWIGFCGFLLISPVRGIWNKYRTKQQLLIDNPDMTPAQAAEIVATAGAVYAGAADDIKREADQVMAAGFLSVFNVSLRRSKQYLLSPTEHGITLYVFDRQQRMEDLVLGKTVDSVPGDVRIDHDTIDGVTLSLRRRMGIKTMYLTVKRSSADNLDYVVSGSASALQIEDFFAVRSGIPVDNQVVADREPLVQMPDIVETVRQADPMVLARMRSSRWLNRLLAMLSALSLACLMFGPDYPALFVVLLFCPIAVTGFYILRQEDVRLDGSRQGRSSVCFAYFWNPCGTSMFAWVILEELGWLAVSPGLWLAGVLGAAAFLFVLFRYVRECHGNVGIKVGMLLFAAAFGTQIVSVVTLILRVCGS